MEKRKTLFIRIAIALALPLIYSCKSKTTFQNERKKYLWKLQLPVGAKCYYTLNGETQTVLKVDSKEVNSSNKSEIGLFYDVSKDSLNNYQVKITYDMLHINLKNKDGEEEEFDASKGTHSFNPVEKLLGTIKGSSLHITVNSKGEILNTSGTKEIADKILVLLNTQDTYSNKRIQDQISKLVGDAFVRNNLEQGFKLFPDSALHIGDSWSGQEVHESDIRFEALTTYTLTSVKDGIAHIEAESNISSVQNNSALMGYNMTSDLTGSQTGEYETDLATGTLLSSKTKTTIQGTVQVMGREVPLKMKVIKEITVKKL